MSSDILVSQTRTGLPNVSDSEVFQTTAIATLDVCNGCYLGADLATITLSEQPGLIMTSPTVYVVFSAYSTINTGLSSGSCTTSAGPATVLNPPSSIVKPSGVDDTLFFETAASQIVSYSGGGTCDHFTPPITPLIATTSIELVPQPTNTTPTNNTSAIANASISSSSASSHIHSANLDTGATIGISVGVSAAFMTLCTLGMFFWRRRVQQNRSIQKGVETVPSHDNASIDDSQPYLQQKAELEVAERRELEAIEERYELQAEERRRQELSSGNFSLELEA